VPLLFYKVYRASCKKTTKRATSGANTPQAEAAARVIKKYPNRRLYDTQGSAYITLAQVREFVMSGEAFAVRDAKTSEDLTRSILLQIILEEESGGVPMFSETVLANLIRFYGHSMQGFVGGYLEKNMQMFTDLQQRMQGQSQVLSPEAWQQMLGGAAPASVQDMMTNYTDQTRAPPSKRAL
jgi:polyhydroxyalkanoate synthesis repressor PhaR